jgi:uncharacterized membrane protein
LRGRCGAGIRAVAAIPAVEPCQPGDIARRRALTAGEQVGDAVGWILFSSAAVRGYDAPMVRSYAAEEGFAIGDFEVAREAAEVIEIAAILVIVIGVFVSLVAALRLWVRQDGDEAFEAFKRYISRGLLVGIDLLIAADLIKTVTLEASLESAVVLGLLVLIRTFLSWSLVVEVEGRWPWQQATRSDTT